VVVLGVEQRDARRVRRDDVAGGVQQLLLGDRALVLGDPVDRARRDLAAAADLEVARADVHVHGREAQPLLLLAVLDLEVVRVVSTMSG
jgi:hypothetical protein